MSPVMSAVTSRAVFVVAEPGVRGELRWPHGGIDHHWVFPGTSDDQATALPLRDERGERLWLTTRVTAWSMGDDDAGVDTLDEIVTESEITFDGMVPGEIVGAAHRVEAAARELDRLGPEAQHLLVDDGIEGRSLSAVVERAAGPRHEWERRDPDLVFWPPFADPTLPAGTLGRAAATIVARWRSLHGPNWSAKDLVLVGADAVRTLSAWPVPLPTGALGAELVVAVTSPGLADPAAVAAALHTAVCDTPRAGMVVPWLVDGAADRLAELWWAQVEAADGPGERGMWLRAVAGLAGHVSDAAAHWVVASSVDPDRHADRWADVPF